MSVIKVVFTFDENYLVQGLVAALSLLDADRQEKYGLFFLSEKPISERARVKFEKVLKGYPNLDFVKFVSLGRSMEGGYESRHLNRSTYLRLEIPELFPEEDKLIYSDVDVLYLGGLRPLWDVNIEDVYVAACLDVGLNRKEVFDKKTKTLSYWSRYFSGRRGSYYQAGLLVMNLRRLRNEGFVPKWREMTRERFEHHDMDILNITCFPHMKKIDSRFNVIPSHFLNKSYEVGVEEGFISEKELRDVYKNPVMLHFAGAKKPWRYPSIPGGYEYWRFLRELPELVLEVKRKYAWGLSERLKFLFSKPLF